MSSVKPALFPRWLLLAVILVAVLAVVSGFAVRQLYSADQTSSTVGQETTGAPATETGATPAVNFSEDAGAHPLAPAVRTLLSAYFTAINTKRYDQWRNLVTVQAAAQNSEAAWNDAFATSQDSDVQVYRINATTSDGVVVLLAFTSKQDLAHAPSQAPSTCDKWWLALPLAWERGSLKVALGTANSTPEVQACAS